VVTNAVTHFAPAARASEQQLAEDVAFVTSSPVVEALLSAAGGVLAVLNEERQIVALNAAFLRMIEAEDAQEVLGLRPGEALGCDHAHVMPAGCGTSLRCATCGAAIAIMAALEGTAGDGDGDERKCILTLDRHGTPRDLCLRVRASRIKLGTLEPRSFLVLFLQDITLVERLAEVQRSFFHDLRNTLMGLRGSAELLLGASESEQEELRENVLKLAGQLQAELSLQQGLAGDGQGLSLGPRQPVVLSRVMRDVLLGARNHSATTGKHLDFRLPPEELTVMGDAVILGRILLNMTLNALEATQVGGDVRSWIEVIPEGVVPQVVLKVWNAAVMPQAVAERVFQRHFSTKAQSGRGLGTWGMKLLGEELLGGKVAFESAEHAGTTFSLSLPQSLPG